MSSKSTLDAILSGTPADFAKTKIICTLGPKSRDVPILEELLRSGMSVARFNFSHGTVRFFFSSLSLPFAMLTPPTSYARASVSP